MTGSIDINTRKKVVMSSKKADKLDARLGNQSTEGTKRYSRPASANNEEYKSGRSKKVTLLII
jgi:hypothetical protein